MKKYMHIEKWGSDEVDGIDIGECHVFPKIDGTNGSVWIENGILKTGSRRRVVDINDDNQGFSAYILSDSERYANFFYDHPHCVIFGEWLVPHSLKTYRDDAWRKFYVFDIFSFRTEEYLHYDFIREVCDGYGIDYVQPISVIRNGTDEIFRMEMLRNTFLLSENSGIGEGIVIKNYDFINKFGRQCWAKMVTSEFKDKHIKEMGPPVKEFKEYIEQKICDNHITVALIEKTYAKILNDFGGWDSKLIPRLLNTVWHDFIKEEMWDVIKKNNNPVIHFSRLYKLCVLKIKDCKKELFSK